MPTRHALQRERDEAEVAELLANRMVAREIIEAVKILVSLNRGPRRSPRRSPRSR